MTVNCPEFIEGCADCAAEAAYRATLGINCELDCRPDPKWDTLCQVIGGLRRDSEEFHVASHQPERCENCATVLSGRIGPERTLTRLCRAGLCTEFYCPNCGETAASEGPIGCWSCGSLGRIKKISRMHVMYRSRKRGRW